MIKIALPAGDLRAPVAQMLSACGLHVEGYGEGSRAYRLGVRGRGDVGTRVFREKDIPIQVALGNYDLGICSLSWVKEIAVRFPEQPVLALCDLGIGSADLYAAAAASRGHSLQDLAALPVVRLASDYPNLAEAFAIAARLTHYHVQAVWGAAEAYPPEDADIAVVAESAAALQAQGLAPLFRLLENSAWLIANREALRAKPLASILGPLMRAAREAPGNGLRLPPPVVAGRPPARSPASERSTLRLAIPDGHQQPKVADALQAAGLTFEGYDDAACVRRPATTIDRLEVKVVRPQDMPQLVAAGQMDLAVTGRDCLLEYLYRFPSSPVVELVDLRRGQYNLSAVISEDVPAGTIGEALEYWRAAGRKAIRIASEFMATADNYARSRHIGRYQIIPIAGASEGFVPEDAELLIEGTETGRTLRENRLKAVDQIYRSTTCLIGPREVRLDAGRRALFDELVAAFERAASAAENV